MVFRAPPTGSCGHELGIGRLERPRADTGIDGAFAVIVETNELDIEDESERNSLRSFISRHTAPPIIGGQFAAFKTVHLKASEL